MKIVTQVIIALLTVFAFLPLIELCVLGINTALATQDFLAVVVLIIEALTLIGLAVEIIVIDIKGERL